MQLYQLQRSVASAKKAAVRPADGSQGTPAAAQMHDAPHPTSATDQHSAPNGDSSTHAPQVPLLPAQPAAQAAAETPHLHPDASQQADTNSQAQAAHPHLHAVPSLEDVMSSVCRHDAGTRHAVALHLDSVHDRARERAQEAEAAQADAPDDASGRLPADSESHVRPRCVVHIVFLAAFSCSWHACCG